jgi:hypothetical protein
MAKSVELDKSAHVIENNGDVVLVRKGDIDDFHIISPDGDIERMRQVGALSEMLFERAKIAFGACMALVVVETHPCRVVVFPRDGGVAVWKTAIGTAEILQAVHAQHRAAKNDKRRGRQAHKRDR